MNTDARTTLLVQHDLIRCQLWTCTRLARRTLAGDDVTGELDEALGRLCVEVAAHHRAEIALLADPAHAFAWGSPAHLVAEQVEEHAALWAVLCATLAEDPQGVLELADDIEAHMADEEHTFLGAPVRYDAFRTSSWAMIN